MQVGRLEMRILIVESSRGDGGTEQHGVILARALQQRGHEVELIARNDTWFANAAIRSGLPVTSVRYGGAADPRLLAILIRRLIARRPQWLMSNDSKLYWPLIVFARVFGVRVALFRHLVSFKHAATRRWVPMLADRFFVVSDYARKSLVAQGARSESIRVLANPIDIEHFRPSHAARRRLRRELGFAESDLVIGFAGRFLQSKGILFLAAVLRDVMAIDPSIHAVWIGNGPDEAMLRTAIDGRFAARHRVLGWRNDLADLMPAFDVLAVPSLAPETFGRVSAEAQACEVPVLCSDAGGLAETLVPGVTGHVLPAGDLSAWRAAITALATDAGTRRRLGVQGRRHVAERFSLGEVCSRLEAHLTKEPLISQAVTPNQCVRRP